MNNTIVEEFLIKKDETLLNAIKKLDNVSGIGLFVHDNHVLCGTLTDGDVRRWLISDMNLDVSVGEIAHKDFHSVNENEEFRAYDIMRENNLKAIAVVDDANRIKNIITAKTLEIATADFKYARFNCPVVMMAGGKGTRLYPYTNVLPKPLIPIGEVPISEHIIRQFNEYGCDSFYLVVNHMKNMIKAYFSDQERDYSIDFVDEDTPLGTGGGLSLLKGKIDNTFILTNCDILIRDNLHQAYKYHKDSGNIITMVCSLQKSKIPYGVVEVNEDGSLIGMKEKPEMSFFTNTGCYFVEPKVINELEENKKIDFPDIIKKYQDQGENIGVFPISSDAWLDMGQPEQLEKMREILG